MHPILHLLTPSQPPPSCHHKMPGSWMILPGTNFWKNTRPRWRPECRPSARLCRWYVWYFEVLSCDSVTVSGLYRLIYGGFWCIDSFGERQNSHANVSLSLAKRGSTRANHDQSVTTLRISFNVFAISGELRAHVAMSLVSWGPSWWPILSLSSLNHTYAMLSRLPPTTS